MRGLILEHYRNLLKSINLKPIQTAHAGLFADLQIRILKRGRQVLYTRKNTQHTYNMKREIDFRGLLIGKDEMVFGYLIIENGHVFICNENGKFEVRNDTQGQFTGTRDNVNIDKIYEDDIIEYTQHFYNIEHTEKRRKVVKWNYDRWNIFETAAGESHIIVIGNIHQNPELL